MSRVAASTETTFAVAESSLISRAPCVRPASPDADGGAVGSAVFAVGCSGVDCGVLQAHSARSAPRQAPGRGRGEAEELRVSIGWSGSGVVGARDAQRERPRTVSRARPKCTGAVRGIGSLRRAARPRAGVGRWAYFFSPLRSANQVVTRGALMVPSLTRKVRPARPRITQTIVLNTLAISP